MFLVMSWRLAGSALVSPAAGKTVLFFALPDPAGAQNASSALMWRA
jgi:hypothetical protein